MGLKKYKNVLICGDAQKVLSTLEVGLVDLIVTSPPYWKQRVYASIGELGTEKTAEEYIQNLVSIFREAKRVLKDQGSLYLVIGDTYVNKSMQGIPWRAALALKDDGWYIRNDIIWAKEVVFPDGRTEGSAAPTIFKCRFNNTKEYVFFLSKTANPYFDMPAVEVPCKYRYKTNRSRHRRYYAKYGTLTGQVQDINIDEPGMYSRLTKNPGSVWVVLPRPKQQKQHIAAYPDALIERPILACCPKGGIVLDPFIGSGTTARVAKRLGRNFIGIDFNRDYIEGIEI